MVETFIASEKTASALTPAATPVAPSAGATVVTVGAVASTVQVRAAGVGSTLPAASFARTSKVWLPAARLAYALGEAQLAQAAPSSRHSKVAPDWLAEKANVAVVWLVGLGGAEEIV